MGYTTLQFISYMNLFSFLEDTCACTNLDQFLILSVMPFKDKCWQIIIYNVEYCNFPILHVMYMHLYFCVVYVTFEFQI